MKITKFTFTVTIGFLVGCAGGTGTGNPLSTGNVNLKSSPYINNQVNKISPLALSDFQFCVTQVALISSVGPLGSYEVNLGLIDVSNSAVDTAWGTEQLPMGFVLTEMTLEIHQDPQLCPGSNFSLRYENIEITKDLEFSFKFDSPVTVNADDTLNLGLSAIATALENARLAGELTNEKIGFYLEGTFGSGEEE